jgi:O-antigen biosynthesis protein WbqP
MGKFFKRLTDIVVSGTALIGFFPIFLAISAAIKLDSRGPIIFKQNRIGLGGRLFEIYKFRTMHFGTPDLPTDQMLKLPSPITKVGSLLRKTSFDELPQLLNVLKGQMSLVGPRPALYNQTELTAMRQAAGVLDFTPGITGWAQINGRDELADSVKVEADKWYCDHWNYWLDWQIIFSTFGAVVSKRGAF